MRRVFGLLTVMAVAQGAAAALPPGAQRRHEIVAIVDDAAVNDAVGGRPIDAVRWLDDDVYLVEAGACRLQVALRTRPSAMPGPRAFSVHVVGAEGCP